MFGTLVLTLPVSPVLVHDLVDVGGGQKACPSAATGPANDRYLHCKTWFCADKRQDALYLFLSGEVFKSVELQVRTFQSEMCKSLRHWSAPV